MSFERLALMAGQSNIESRVYRLANVDPRSLGCYESNEPRPLLGVEERVKRSVKITFHSSCFNELTVLMGAISDSDCDKTWFTVDYKTQG
jgi:hypothetical protein